MQISMAQPRLKLSYWQKIFFATLMLLGLNGCASIPEREFTDYLATFEQVRKASELVLIDYAAAKKEKLALDPAQTPALRQASFQTNQVLVAEDSIDDVAIRFKIWEIVDTYNQTLVSLLAGNAVKTEDKSKMLLRTLVGLSGQAFVTVASNISPAFAALKNIGSEIGKAYQQQKIVSILLKVSPVISTQLISTLQKDSELFYQVRYGLNSYHYQQINAKIGRKIAEFVKLAYSVSNASRNKTVLPMVKTLNTSLASIAKSSTGTGLKAIELKPQFGKDDSAQTLAQLANLKEQILSLIDQANQQNKVLEAYRQMLSAYVRMLYELDFQLKLMLEVAQQQQAVEVLMANDFNDTVLRMRQAYLYYQNNHPIGAY